MPLPALAGPALVAGAQVLTNVATQKLASGGPQNDGYMEGSGLLAKAGTALAGGVTGAAMRTKDLGPDASPREKIAAGLMGGALGAGSGLLANMQNDAIQGGGGSLKSAVFGAGASMLASKLEKDGPNMLQSAMIGGGTGLTANILHDKATDKGYGMQADLAAGALEGGALGYTGMGDLKGGGLGAALGGVAGFASNKLTEQQGVNAGLTEEQESLMQSDGATNAVNAQSAQKGMADNFVNQYNQQQANQPVADAPQKDNGGMQLG